MNDDNRRRASSAYFKRREERGDRRITVWTTLATRARLTELAKTLGSKDAAVAEAIRQLYEATA